MDHAALRELAAGSALDDLDPLERRLLDDHVARCSDCRALERQLGDVLADLALTAPVLHPPRELRADILRAIARPGRRVVSIGSWVRRSGSGWNVAALGLAAGLAAVAVGLGLRANGLADELARERAALAVAADPGHRSATLHAVPIAPTGDAIVVYLPGTDEAWLLARDLPATPAGRVYQLWFVDPAGVHGLGTFSHDGTGPFIAPFGVDLGAASAAMVTLEPEGGAVGAPGPEIVFGEL